jgi:hypothetical protein
LHLSPNSPWWFSSDGSQRFDLRRPDGTCYVAERPTGAFLEVATRFHVIKRAELDERRLAAITVDADIRLADCLAARAASFGVTAEVSAGYPYNTVSQPWARRCTPSPRRTTPVRSGWAWVLSPTSSRSKPPPASRPASPLDTFPTAVHLLAEVQETPNKLGPDPGLGVGSIAHVVPFRASASVAQVSALKPSDPTTVHALADEHDTPKRYCQSPRGSMVSIVHVVPFRVSTNAARSPALLVYHPAATHTVAEVHDTP